MTNPLKIAFICSYAGLYGANRSLYMFLEAINRKQYEPILILPSEGPFVEAIKKIGIEPNNIVIIPKDPEITPSNLQPSPFKISDKIFSKLFYRLTYLIKLFKLLRSQKPDIVYLHTIRNCTSALAAKFNKIPIIWHVHESAIDFKGVRKVRFWALSKYAHKVIAVSEYNVNILKHMGLNVDRVAKVYNGVDLNRFSNFQPDDNLCKSLGLAGNEVVIGLIGQICRNKGVLEFVEAAKRVSTEHPKAKFLVVGGASDSEPEYVNQVKQLCANYQLSDKMAFVGFQEDVRQYLAIMDILVVASYAESFPMVNLEAMAMGKPIVATEVGGNSEAIIQGETGFLVPSGHPEMIADALLKLMADESLRKKMGRSGRARVERMFSAEVYRERLEEVLTKAISRQPSAFS